MNSLKQVIVAALIKVSADPMYAGREYASADAARDDFIKALIAELFPECPDCVLPSAVQASEVVVVAEEADGGGPKVETLPERVAKRKLSKEEKEAEKKAKEEAKKAKEEAKEAEKKAKEEAKAAKAEAKKPKAAAAAPVEAPAAEAPVKEKKKPGPKPKAKAAADGPVNLEKLNPTQTKKLKSIAEELKVEADKKAFHEYLNSLPKAEYDAKTFDDHVRAFLTPEPADEEPVLTKCARVEWPEGSGVTYLVDPETKKVYKPNGSVNEKVGHLGVNEFEGMEIPVA